MRVVFRSFLTFIFALTILQIAASITDISAYAIDQSGKANEIVVKFEDGESPQELKENVDRRKLADSNIIEKIKKVREDIIIRLRGEQFPEDKLRTLQANLSSLKLRSSRLASQEVLQRSPSQELKSISIYQIDQSTAADVVIKQLKKIAPVQYVEKNVPVRARATRNDTYYESMWSLPLIEAPEAWDIGGTAPVTVAVIDTGIDYTHADLPTDIIRGTNYIASGTDPMDDNGHGTHVAGTIAALADNSTGVTGLNSYVDLMAIKVLDVDGNGYMIDTAAAIVEAADAGAQVLNLSLGGPGDCPSYLQDAIDYAYGLGTTVVVATGQDLDNPPNVDIDLDTPTSCNNVISVAATGPTDARAAYSGYGTTIDIAAPGGDYTICGTNIACMIVSTYPGDQYSLSVGTSMATPHVAGLVSLMLSKNPALTPAELESLLKSSADTIATDYPIGKRINAYAALTASIPTPTLTNTPTPTPTPTLVDQTITWTTGTAASSRVEYGLITSYGYLTPETDTSPRVTDHSVTLTNLLPCTVYQYRTRSIDADLNEIVGENQSFTTEGCGSGISISEDLTQLVTGTSGGIISLTEPLSGGITVEVPAGFTSGTEAYFQVLRIPRAQALQSFSSPTNYTGVGAYAYQITSISDPSTQLSSFESPISITLRYANTDMTGLNDNTLMISRNGGYGWNTLSNCATDKNAREVTCATTAFSLFALFAQSVSVQSPGQSQQTTSSTTDPPVCRDSPPSKAPDLFQIDRDKDQAVLYFAPAGNPVTYYYIGYGLSESAEQYGTQFAYGASTGVINHTIKNLAEDATYYFKVRAGNGCMPGPWSGVKVSSATSEKSNGQKLSARDSKKTNYDWGTDNQDVAQKDADSNGAPTSITALPQAGAGTTVTFGILSTALVLLGIFL